MQFDSLTFIVFFVCITAAYSLLGKWNHRKTLLLIASYTFYAAWNPLLLPLLIGSSIFDWYAAIKMDASQSNQARKRWLIAIISINLSILGFFKYFYFLSDTAVNTLAQLNITVDRPEFDIILPIGISFYTFHSLSYCIDIYRRRFCAVNNLRDYLLYVSFFPQLVAGPIVRWHEMGPQLQTPRALTLNNAALGLCLMIIGLFQKVVLADAIFAPVSDAFYSSQPLSQGSAWLATLAFSGQIFCDFSGYSTCAIGAALILGFKLPINFLSPYAALGFSDFWQRWHISLSSWLRDYLYIGLGGNRHGKLQTYRNLILTMLIGGLWHGAGWTFIIWGLLHGLLLVGQRLCQPIWSAMPTGRLFSAIGIIATFIIITFTWVWFRAPSIEAAWHTSLMMMTFTNFTAANHLSGAELLALSGIVGLLAVHGLTRQHPTTTWLARVPPPVLGILIGALGALIVLSPGESHAFIYFQF